MAETSSGGLFPVNIARVAETLDNLADDIELIASGRADDRRDYDAWEHRVNAGRQLVRLRAALNNGDLDRADCALDTLGVLRRVWQAIDPVQEKEYHGGPLFLPGEVGPLSDGLPLRHADEPYDLFAGLRPKVDDGAIAEAVTELEQKASGAADDARKTDLAIRALQGLNKPRLTTKRERWGGVPSKLRALSAKLAGLEFLPLPADSRCDMDLAFLRDEFLRLSAKHRQLRHGLVVWEQRPDDSFNEAHVLLKRSGVEVIGLGSTLTTDSRADSFWLWHGAHESGAAMAAIGQFEALARIASERVALRPFPRAVAPKTLVQVGDGSVDHATGGHVITWSDGKDKVHRWLAHLFVANAVASRRTELKSKDGRLLWQCDVLLLPFDVFRASVFALDATDGDTGNSGKQTDVALDDATMAAASGMLAHLRTLGGSNTTVRGWLVEPPTASNIGVEIGIQNADQQIARFAQAVGDDNALKIIAIAQRSDLSGEKKMKEILKIDRRFEGKDSNQWADLLGVSAAAVRGYQTWKDLQRRRKSD
jgi:hypothetical protein